MKHTSTKAGFTLLEMLVASLLLGMLVTILTMVFNSSSIAWRTGKAGNVQMSKVRYQLSLAQQTAESALPRIDVQNKSRVGRVLSAWDETGAVRQRGVGELKSAALKGLYTFPSWDSRNTAGSSTFQPWVVVRNINDPKGQSAGSYTVGVLSYGPDGKVGTADDIDTWPELEEP